MKLQTQALSASALMMFVVCLRAQSAPDRLIGVQVNPAMRTTLGGAAMPSQAVAAASSVKVDAALPMDRMVLLLQPSAGQDAALDQLLKDQSNPASPRYGKFLNPSDFADSFGVSNNDVAKLTAWLVASGFRIDEVTPSRRAIVFSGTAAQVTFAFNTEIREYVVKGEKHIANSSAPQVPSAFAPVIRGLLKLHDFHSKPATHGVPVPLNTSAGGSHYLAPADYGVIYNLNTLFNSGITGVSQSIAVVGRSNVNASDINTFRINYGLPAANLTPVLATGVDPGFTSDGDALEATLDVEWAGAIAPAANVKLVIAPSSSTTDGIDLAAQYAVNHKVSTILSVSFGICEANANSAFYNSLWQQASAQGMTVLIAAGDSGAADCDGAADLQGSVAAVNALCSTSYDTCVGGTMFNDTADPGQYWLPGNNGSLGSAISYIPELAWNESGAVAGGTDLFAGGGGVSKLYIKPYWQTGPGVPADGHRDVPDVSLAASQHDGYLLVYNGASSVVSGTSAATPAFAGIMALVDQKNGGSQGNINPTLYSLAAKTSSVFHDITAGSNSVPGVAGFSAAAGYDSATGLGSVDAAQLVNNWTSSSNQFSFTASGTTIGATPAQSGTLTLTALDSGSFQSTLTLTVLGLPNGVSARFTPANIVGSGSTVLTLTVSGYAVSGISPLTITATGGGITRSVNVSLTVTVTTGCTLTSTPASLSVLLNQSGAVKLSCVSPSGSFANNLALSVSGLPASVSATFSPTSIAAGTGISSLVVTAGAAAVPGNYYAIVTAVLPGSSPLYSTTLSIPLKVAAPATFTITPSSSSITVQQASSGFLTLTSVHGGSFNNSISLMLSTMPSGATASLPSLRLPHRATAFPR